MSELPPPIPIEIALVSASHELLSAVKKHFRLSLPGMIPAYLIALDANSANKNIHPSEVPKGRITLWLALDAAAFSFCKECHSRDLRIPRYRRGYYGDIFPEACVLIDESKSNKEIAETLACWRQKIIDAYEAS